MKIGYFGTLIFEQLEIFDHYRGVHNSWPQADFSTQMAFSMLYLQASVLITTPYPPKILPSISTIFLLILYALT